MLLFGGAALHVIPMRRPKLISVLLCMLSSGCVGVGVWSTEKASFYEPRIYETAGMDGVREQPYRGTTDTITYSSQWLQSHWGEPKSVRRTSSVPTEELWTYKFGTCWCGLVPMVVIPIPLVLPVKSEEIVFQIRNGQVVRARRVISVRSGVGAGFFGPEGPWAAAGGSW